MRQDKTLDAGFLRDPPAIPSGHMSLARPLCGVGAVQNRDIGLLAKSHHARAVFRVAGIGEDFAAVFHPIALAVQS